MLDGVSAFPRVLSPLVSPFFSPCLPLSPFLFPFLFPFVGWCVRLPEGLVSPFLSPCLPSFSPSSVLLGVLNAFLRCPPWCSMVCPPKVLSPFVSHCAPSCFPLSDGVSALPRVLSPFVSHCTPSCFPLLDGVSAFPRLLSAFVSHCTPSCFPLLDSPFVSHCTPSCFPLLDGLSAFPRVLSPFVSHCTPSCFPLLDGVSAFPRLLSAFVSHCTPSCFPLLDAVPLLVSPCWMVCPPFRASAFPRVLSPNVSHYLPTCVSVLDGTSAFLRSCPIAPHCLSLSPHCVGWCARGLVSPSLPLSPLSPIVSPHVCLCWMVRPPSRGFVSPLVSHCLPSCFPVLDGVSAFPRFCLPCLPACLSTCLSSCFPLWRVVSFCFFPKSVRLGVPQKHVLNPPTVWGLPWSKFYKNWLGCLVSVTERGWQTWAGCDEWRVRELLQVIVQRLGGPPRSEAFQRGGSAWVPCPAFCPSQGAVWSLRDQEEEEQHQAICPPRLHHGWLRGAHARMAELCEGRRGFWGSSSKHLSRDFATEQDLASDQEEPCQEVPGDVCGDCREEGQGCKLATPMYVLLGKHGKGRPTA